jgi:GcpE protein
MDEYTPRSSGTGGLHSGPSMARVSDVSIAPCSKNAAICTQVGPVSIGSEHRVALQTMTTSDTRDVEASVAEVKRCADAGADLVRLTVQVYTPPVLVYVL